MCECWWCVSAGGDASAGDVSAGDISNLMTSECQICEIR